jgi:hypothetical protein
MFIMKKEVAQSQLREKPADYRMHLHHACSNLVPAKSRVFSGQLHP